MIPLNRTNISISNGAEVYLVAHTGSHTIFYKDIFRKEWDARYPTIRLDYVSVGACNTHISIFNDKLDISTHDYHWRTFWWDENPTWREIVEDVLLCIERSEK